MIVVFIMAPRGGWGGGMPRVAGTLAVEKLRTKLARGEERARKLREEESAPRSELAALGLPLWAYLAISHGDYSLLFITLLCHVGSLS